MANNEKHYTAPIQVTIATGTSLSPAVNLESGSGLFPGASGWRLCSIIIPAVWTAANLTFQGSADGATYFDVYDRTGVEYTAVVAANRLVILPPLDLISLPYIKIRSGTGSIPVAQAADRVLNLLLKQV